MDWRWVRALAVAAPIAAAPLPAQQVPELGVQLIATASEPGMVVGGGYAALRVARRLRLSAGAGLGGSGGETAWRGELLAHFLLAPGRREGVGAYAAAGIAGVGGTEDEGYMVLTLGLESRPRMGLGWFMEGGVGGGVRLAAGYRWRFYK
jgi:hypothetical protein